MNAPWGHSADPSQSVAVQTGDTHVHPVVDDLPKVQSLSRPDNPYSDLPEATDIAALQRAPIRRIRKDKPKSLHVESIYAAPGTTGQSRRLDRNYSYPMKRRSGRLWNKADEVKPEQQLDHKKTALRADAKWADSSPLDSSVVTILTVTREQQMK
jgi:hypothetical protein